MFRHIKSNKSKYCLILICAVALVISTKGITDEGVVAMNGDMPKYLMNGVFFYDLIKDLSFTNPLEYAYQYYARYPALSLGHHPLLLGVAEVPFYSVFGISVFSARLTIVFFTLLAAITWFRFVRHVYDETAACFSSLLMVTMPFIVLYSRIVMSEIPTLALIISAIYFFYRYCESEMKKYAYISAVCLTLSVYSKHLALFLLPVFLFYLLIRKGPRSLLKREVIFSCLIIGLLLLPFVLITLKFSRANIDFVSVSLSSESSSLVKPLSSRIYYYMNAIGERHLTLPVLILSLISIPVSVYRRDGRTIIFFLWITCLGIMIVYLGWKVSRYAIYWIPVFCLFAAMTVNFFKHRFLKVFTMIGLVVIVAYQFSVAFKMKPEFADGYEETARYVVDNKKGQSILFSGVNDTGYFIFFVRKHNPEQDLIVLRADKIMATSKMSWIVEERINTREEIYDALRNYGVGYVVIEDTESASRSLEWLREEVKSGKFVLRKMVKLQSNNHKTNDIPLSIYEYKEYTPSKKGQTLIMNIPLMGGAIEVPFENLRPKK